jgi:hypothetical protein
MSSYTPRHSGGRPAKYSSPDERNATRQAQHREDNRRRRERKRAERLSSLQSPQVPNDHPDYISNQVSHMLPSEAESLHLHAIRQNRKNTSSLYCYRSYRHQLTKNDHQKDQIMNNLKNDQLCYSPVSKDQAALIIHRLVKASTPNTRQPTKRIVMKVTTLHRMRQHNRSKVFLQGNQ